MATLRRRSTLGSNSNLDVSIDHNDDGLSPVSSYTPRRFAKIERSPAMDKLLFIVGVVLLVLPWVFHSNQDYQMRLLESDIEALQQERRRLKDQVTTYSTTIAGVRQQADVVERQSSLMLEQIHASGDTIDLGLDKYHDAETVEDAMFGRLDDMEQALQHRAKRNLREQYGDGPYQVKVTLTDGQWFVVETAPREAMPHAIELFLRLVELHAYDGLSLSRSKSSSILHTAEISARKQVYLQEHFAQFNIPTKMAFAERSEDYVMEKYSGTCNLSWSVGASNGFSF